MILNGSIEEPLNPLSLLMEAGATFVARGYAGRLDHLSGLIVKAIEHEGFSIIDVLQPCVVFHNTYKEYNESVEIIEHPPESYEKAIKLVKEKGKRLPIGIFYQINKPVFHKELYGEWNPITKRLSKGERKRRVKNYLKT